MKLLSCLLIAALAPFAVQDDPEPVEPVILGTVAGRVVFEGELPGVKPLAIQESQIDPACCGDPAKFDRTDMRLLIDAKSRGIQNAVVTLTVPTIDLAVPEEPVLIDQKDCRFFPHVTVVPVGGSVTWRNSDPGSHNVHTYSQRNTPFNRTNASDTSLTVKMKHTETFQFSCDLHPWMKGHLIVTDATHHAVTNADGSFSLEGVPPGSYTLNVWHETLPRSKVKVVVGADGSVSPVEVKLAAKPKSRRR